MPGRWRRWGVGASSAVLCVTVAASASAQARNWPVEEAPRPLAARRANFPPYEVRTLPNGMQVVVVLHHEQPAVSMRLLVRAGAAYVPPGKFGLTTLLAALLDQGTATRSAQQIADTIDSIGGSLDTGAGTDLTFVSVLVMKDSFQLGMDMIADVTRHPAFDAEEIERQRQQVLSGLRVSYEDPTYVASAVFDRLIYGVHPYGMPNSGIPDSVSRVTREDIREFHRRYFAPNNCILAIVGDVTGPEAFTAAERAFGDWPRQEIQVPHLPDPPAPTRRVIVVDKPDAVQTEVRVGHLGVARGSPDFMALDLAMNILGGEGSNRLHRVLRTERSLTYGASADMDTMLQAGDFVAETDTRSEATGEVLRLTVEEFSRLRRDRISERELTDAQAYLTGSFPLTIETPDEIATQILNTLFYNLSLDELQTYRQRVNAVTVDGIQRVARRYLQPDRLSVVLVGNVAAFKGQLQSAGFGTYEVVPLSDLDLTSADFKRSSTAVEDGPAQTHPAAAGVSRRAAPATSAQELRTPVRRTPAVFDKPAQGRGQ